MSHIREFEHLKITLEAIKSATNNFAPENCIGRGGFGNVYKGEIVHSRGQSMVAFKRLDRAFGQGNTEFWKEITMLSLYKHENLVHLLGFCDESDEKILVYQYASNRSLDLYLDSNDLTWTQRLKICIGVARGLSYLHNSETNVRVLHRDIKSSNILLDENWNAKLSDFGLSKFARADKFTFLFTCAVGTLGYCDPLYAETGFLTKESDIYSLGVVLFEVLCGRLCIDKKDGRPLIGLARHCYELNKVDSIIFSSMVDEINPNSLRAFTTIAYQCLKIDREKRPSIIDVVRMLETALKYQVTVHKLEQESAFFFNMKYFEEQVQAGEWDEVEKYLCGFTKVEDNRYSMKIFFEIRKQKYLEALDRNDRAEAVEILVKDLKVFSTFNEKLFKEITQLLTLDNFRQNKQLSKYGDTKSARSIMLVELKLLIEANPLFREKLTLSMPHAGVAAGPPGLVGQPPVTAAFLKHPRTPPGAPGLEYQMADSEHLMKRARVGASDEVKTVTSWKLPDIVDSSHLKALRLPDPTTANKVMGLIYTNSGLSLLALASNAIWKWQRSERNPSGKSTASIVPQLWQPANGGPMSNDVSESKPAEESAACIALSKNDSYVMSASGGKVSLFNMMTFKVMTTFMPPPPAATYLAFHPQNNFIIAIGMEDSTIQIYNVRVDEVKMKLKGHQKQITGLAFSQTLNALVSSGADAQLCIWNINGWEKRKSRSIQSPPGHPSSLIGETKVQFHNDQRHLLVVHESQIAIYDHQLECLKLWSPRESISAAISSAIYSCDGLLLFTGFSDGAVGVFDADNLRLRCRIAPSAYISSSISSSNSTAYPAVIAAHPSDPNQFALGMSDGSVHVIEPTDADPKWGGPAPQENGGGSLPSNPSNSALNSQPSETPSR